MVDLPFLENKMSVSNAIVCYFISKIILNSHFSLKHIAIHVQRKFNKQLSKESIKACNLQTPLLMTIIQLQCSFKNVLQTWNVTWAGFPEQEQKIHFIAVIASAFALCARFGLFSKVMTFEIITVQQVLL